MKKYIYPLAFAAAITATTSCSDKDGSEVLENKPTSEKEMISFSMSDAQGAVTRGTRAGFETATGLLMHIQSENKEEDATETKYTRTQASAEVQIGTGETAYSNVSFSSDDFKRYWDDAHGRDSWLSVYAVAVPGYTIGATGLQLTEDKLNKPASGTWGTDNATTHTIQWTVKTDGQTSATNATEDLVYANNIRTDGTDGRYWYKYTNDNGSDVGYWMPGNKSSVEEAKTGATSHGDGRMRFVYSNTSDHTSAGKFDRGHLKFNHALTRLTITLVEGTGFDKTPSTGESDFNFDTDKVYVQINGANKKGTLNLVDGKWSLDTSAGTGIVKLTPSTKSTTSNTSSYTLNAQILPDNVWSGAAASPKNVLEFFIDNNHYFVTEAQLYTALSTAKKAGDVAMSDDELTASGINKTDKTVTLTQGVNYNLKITVDKKQIETITAVLASWSEVIAANENIDNSHITINTHKDANGNTEEASSHWLYLKTEDLGQIYTDDSYTSKDSQNGKEYSGPYKKNEQPTAEGGKWNTTWFYDDNKTAYHIRSVNKSAHDKMQNASPTDTENTYFTIANGSSTADGDHDYHWGAPLKDGVIEETATGYYKYPYNVENGYKALLYPGVTAVKSGDLNITELHMMSNIEVIVRTTTGSNAVKLEDGENQCEVTLTRLYSAGQVDLGTGKVTETGDATGNSAMDKPATGTSSSENVTIDGTTYSTIQTKPFTLAVVPQPLYRGSKTGDEIATDAESEFVGITVKTPDNNQYYIVKRLQEIVASSVGTSNNQIANAQITRWYPNHKYIYTITLTKVGIQNITCTLADWSTVTGENVNIDLES